MEQEAGYRGFSVMVAEGGQGMTVVNLTYGGVTSSAFLLYSSHMVVLRAGFDDRIDCVTSVE